MKTIIKLTLAALCLISSSAFAEGMQTSGGVKPRPDARFGSASNDVYVMLNSIKPEKNFNNVQYFQALVNSKKSTVQKIQLPEHQISPEVLEALQKSMQQDGWIPLNIK